MARSVVVDHNSDSELATESRRDGSRRVIDVSWVQLNITITILPHRNGGANGGGDQSTRSTRLHIIVPLSVKDATHNMARTNVNGH